jgi:hypothetical protein
MRIARLLVVPFAATALLACKPSSTHAPQAVTDQSAAATTSSPSGPDPSRDLAYVCPMDPDIRSNEPGKCPRCGMALVAGVPDPSEFHLDMTVTPKPLRPNEPARLIFSVFDPWKNNPIRKFNLVHEKLFHAFIVSRDLEYFAHEHPVWDGQVFRHETTFPKPGMYRIAGDFYPEAATPQLLTETLFVAGSEPPPRPIARDYSTKSATNLSVSIATQPEPPIAGVTAQIRLTLDPGDGLERYLGAWGHMLAGSDDLIDMIHTHPFIADGSPVLQFSLAFPRPRTYRVWLQFQRRGVINTVHFDIPVAPAPSAHPSD